jgi:TetR/AcrR family transcriptional regulator, transcriptional repressor for nem operon
LTADPLQQLLTFLGLFIEHTDQLDAPFPGCLYASYCYQSGAIGPDVIDEMRHMMRLWRTRLASLVERVAERYPPHLPVEPEHLADHVLASLEGAFILAKILDDPRLASQQLIQCRNYVELLFGGPAIGGNEAAGSRGSRA